MLAGACSGEPAPRVLLDSSAAETTILSLDHGVGNIDPEEAAQFQVAVIVYGDGRLELDGESAGVITQQQLDEALEVLGDMLKDLEKTSELAHRGLSDNDDGGVATLVAELPNGTARVRLAGLLESENVTSREADQLLRWHSDFDEVADPGFWNSDG